MLQLIYLLVAEVPLDRQGFERVGFELIDVPDDFVGGKFTYKVVGDDVTVHEVLAQNGAIVLGIPGDNDTFAPIDYMTLQFTGPENVSGLELFKYKFLVKYSDKELIPLKWMSLV